MTYDSATWLAFALVLTALGGVVTWTAWRKRGVAGAVRPLGWTVLPLAAWMTGTLRLAVEVASDVGDWASRLVFSPRVWTGIALAIVGVVLIGGGGALRRRAGGRAGRKAAGPTTTAGSKQVSARSQSTDTGVDDDIEAILRKHGIS